MAVRLHAYMRFVQAVIGVLPSVYTFSFWKNTQVFYTHQGNQIEMKLWKAMFSQIRSLQIIYIYIYE